MAHADYDCCAVCDCKLTYRGCFDAETKQEFCDDCFIALKEAGVPVEHHKDVDSFIKWINDTNPNKVEKILLRIGFKFCRYDNEVDAAVIHKIGKKEEFLHFWRRKEWKNYIANKEVKDGKA